jgi:hypothetical protein
VSRVGASSLTAGAIHWAAPIMLGARSCRRRPVLARSPRLCCTAVVMLLSSPDDAVSVRPGAATAVMGIRPEGPSSEGPLSRGMSVKGTLDTSSRQREGPWAPPSTDAGCASRRAADAP